MVAPWCPGRMVKGMTDDSFVGLTKPPSSPGWIVNVESMAVFHMRILSLDALYTQCVKALEMQDMLHPLKLTK
jgi:hypothetical protein